MKVLLTHPVERSPLLVTDDLGLGYLAASLRRHGIDVRIELQSLSRDRFIQGLKDDPPDIVGIKTYCTSAKAVNKTIELVRSMLPSAHCIIGGPQVNAMPDSVLTYINADAAIHGDGERSLPRYIKALSNRLETKNIPGLIYRDGNSIRVNPQDVIEDLDSLDFPAWDIMIPHKGGRLQLSRYNIAASVITSRGCAGRCTFCSEAATPVRRHSPEYIIEELLLLQSKYKVDEIMFQDSNFLSRRDNSERLFSLMIKQKFNLPWQAPYGTRAETLHYDLLRLMKKAGCYRISIGVETGSEKWQRQLRKNINLSMLKEKVRLCRRIGIEVMANFIYGFPGETRKDMEETRRLAMELEIDYASFYIFTPYPGSQQYQELLAAGIIREEDFRQFDKLDYKNNLSEISSKELYWLVRRSLFGFYLQPRHLKCLLFNMRHPNFIRSVFKIIYYSYLFPHRSRQHAY